jgi:hypothetical protein
MGNFQPTPTTGNPTLDESINKASTNFRIDNIQYKYYVYLLNGDGKFLGLTSDSIELLNIKDNILEMAASGTCVIRNDNDAIERSNFNDQLNQKENYFQRQPKNNSGTVIDEFFFRNDCRDYLVVYIRPELKDLVDGEDTDKIKPVSTLFYTFSIIENEDVVGQGDDDARFKKLTLIDNDLEILREKNLFFSSSKIVTAATGKDLAHLDDDERGTFTGLILKELIIQGLDAGGSAEKTEQNGSVIDEDLFSLGTSTLFYSSPGEYNVLTDIDYVLKRHTSAAPPHDPCLLRKDRYSQKYTLISYKDYFRNAIFQSKNGSSGGLLHLETIYLADESLSIGAESPEIKQRTPLAPFNNLSFNEFSQVNTYNFFNMSGLDTQSKLITTAVHSYQLSDKQFQIDLYNNNISTSMTTYYDYFVRGDKEYPLFVGGNSIYSNTFLNQFRKNNLNYKNIFSINDTEPDQRLGLGRNDILKNAIFLNNAIELDLKGLTFRSSGKFFSFARKNGAIESKYDDKVFGTYLAVQVDHNFSKNTYNNKVIGIKTYLFDNPILKEVK